MPRSPIQRIRERIRRRQYDMSAHAMEELAEDNLDIIDVEQLLAGTLHEPKMTIGAARSTS